MKELHTKEPRCGSCAAKAGNSSKNNSTEFQEMGKELYCGRTRSWVSNP